MPDPEAMDRIRKVALGVPGALGIEKCFARKTGSEVARGSAPGSGSGHERLRIARDRHAGARPRIRSRSWIGWPTCWCTWSRTCLGYNLEQDAWKIVRFARMLAETADLMEIAGEDGFRIRSYRNAASAIEGLPGARGGHPGESGAQGHRDSRRRQGPRRRRSKRLPSAARFEKRDALLAQFPPTLLELLQDSGARARRASRWSTSTTKSPPSTSWSASARSRSCASCRAWARSSKRRCSSRSRNIASAPAAFC